MPRASMPKPTWEKLKTDPDGWRLKYINDGVELGEPAFFKGDVAAEDYEDANHILFDDARVSSILVRSQGQNPIEIRISSIDQEGNETGVWVPLAEAPYYGPAEKPNFPPESIWSAWNEVVQTTPTGG